MDITPHVNLLKSLRGERIDYVLLVGEGIDNAFDAGASRIDVVLDESEISFQDDGIGVTRDRIASVFSLGDHGPMTTTQLGRFGIGIKSQAVNAGNIFQILSVSADGRVKMSVDWRKILRSGQWLIDDPKWMPVVNIPTGTTITIGELRSTKTPPGGWPRKIASDVAERFFPAIAIGQRISLNGEPIPRLSEPAMTDIIERHISLSDGRAAYLRAGILTAPSRLNRVHVAYKHRVIMPASTLGCGEYGGLIKMFARLQLTGPWHLAKFKNELTDEDEREELEEAVIDILRPILEKCNSASLSARVNEITHLINEMVPPDLKVTARPKRSKEQSTPGKKTSSQGSVAPEKSVPPGPAKTKRQHRLLITFDGVADQVGVGEFQSGRPHRVNLSKDDPYIMQLLEQRDQQFGASALYAIAIALYEEGREQMPEPELPLDPFGKRIAKLISIQRSTEAAA
jgi:hypothetical protein